MSAERSATPTTAKPMIPVAKLVARGSAMLHLRAGGVVDGRHGRRLTKLSARPQALAFANFAFEVKNIPRPLRRLMQSYNNVAKLRRFSGSRLTVSNNLSGDQCISQFLKRYEATRAISQRRE